MKKIFQILSVAVIVLTAASCGGGSGKAGNSGRAQSSLNASNSAEDYIEPIEGGVYAVYGDTDENREFLDYIDWNRKWDITGIAVRVNSPDGDYWLVRALEYSGTDRWSVAMALAAKSKVAGGQAVLGTPAQWLALKQYERPIDMLARKLPNSAIFNRGFHWTSTPLDGELAEAFSIKLGVADYYTEPYVGKLILLLAVFKIQK
ncbi:MAG: hypothetical protein LBT48_00775 [Prevotellaceae bacterium]|jgi:hypothetical protein|nr:hypothetical protein [Prevotellaceae bacterium]